MDTENTEKTHNFIRDIIKEDIESGKCSKVCTRFPPEPNGYLHIGHAKAICVDFGLAEEFNGICNLRFDDTNPSKEKEEYVDSIKEDIKWLGFDWGEKSFYASDYFDKMYEYALVLIKKGKAYVDDLSAEEIREYRGTLTEPGKNSPSRDRSVDENLQLFEKMRNGEFKDGERVLRAKIDMASPNINMRDPIMYRIMRSTHNRTGDKWCIYPTYDWAHGLEDSLEGVVYSLCDLSFEDHRPLYDWFLNELGVHHPRQIEFARLNITYTVLSKRELKKLVEYKHVSGWDDPRMPTLSGLRRRGYTPESIKDFCERIGVAKRASVVDVAMLEHCLREDLNKKAQRVMGVLNPLKVTIENYPEDKTEELDAINNPEDESMGIRKVPFSRVIYIEKDDFMEEPPKKFFRLAPGREVRLRYAYFIKCERVIKDSNGEIKELICTYDPATRGGDSPDGRKVKATLHWVSDADSVTAEVRLYDSLFTDEVPKEITEDGAGLNPKSLTILKSCKIEPNVRKSSVGEILQFERQGYFCVDKDTKDGNIVFNRSVSLKDSWARILKAKKQNG